MHLNLIKVLMTCLALLLSNFANGQGFSKLLVFGDSLSDTGNLAAVTVDLPFPFFNNRISNGPILADYLAEQINSNAAASEHLAGQSVGFNYAVAGGNLIGNDPEDLAAQISAYLARSQGKADARALYFIFMGGNDLRDIRSIKSQALVDARISQMIDELESQIRRLASGGATTFLLPNMPNIGRLPETIQRLASDPEVVDRARANSMLYNQRLSVRLAELQNELNVGISEFDLFSEFELLFGNAQQLGFTETEAGCFDLDGFRFEPECVFGTRFDRFVFFDNLHPSAKTNQLIGQKLAQFIPTGVFEPSITPTIAPIIRLLLD